MHNASLRHWCLIDRSVRRYLSGNATDNRDLNPATSR
jgi:hypothetical protein